ncbi:hypothetical protein [Ruegeria arenilitoris]|uniref:hypothetical protein n=1 Tax=Ruegeria arenilitoris TaxID=1173585 RepID=UPI00147ACA0F|nr:hypothetical protein [Ruegeria arenilitoris]
MKSDISEFSYGFALTNELVGWVNLRAAPIFPSLIEEGKPGGGYDVKLDAPGIPLYIQFKRSDYMTRRSAKEYKAVRDVGGRLRIPYYRFPVTPASVSDQHEMLLDLDDGTNLVFYAAPRFYKPEEINAAWASSEVAHRSIFVTPRAIGTLDDMPHNIAFDQFSTWRCSEPENITALSSSDMNGKLLEALESEKAPLKDRLPSIVEDLRRAESRGRQTAEAQRRLGEEKRRKERASLGEDDQPVSDSLSGQFLEDQVADEDKPSSELPSVSQPVQIRAPKELDDSAETLREAADIAARVFDVQFMIVQTSD